MTPMTEAGKRLVSKANALNARSFAIVTVDDILAIEAEARIAALRDLRVKVEGMPHGSSCALVVMNVGDCDCHMAAVLREIDRAVEP
jgi:hypothetical protein